MAAFSVRARTVGLGLILAFAALSASVAAPLSVVAAENVYGDIAAQIGGDRVSVVSVLNNPAQDPHLFEAGAATARALAGAGLVLYNGADYDPWMPKLLAVTGGGARRVIVAAELAHKGAGDNPHLWYDPAVASTVAKAVADDLSAADPANAADYAARFQLFGQAVQPLSDKIAAMRGKYAGMPITATEPVFDYMAQALGLQVRNPAFQRAVMNGTEPAARDVAAFEADLKEHRVKALLYNIQSGGNLSQRVKAIAEAAKVPVVGISETEPVGMRYQDWMMAELDALDATLAGASP